MKDPAKPKKPCSAYICFTNAKREGVCAANPTMPHTEVMKVLGQMWQAETHRAPYDKLAAADKARYDKAMASYVPPPDSESPKKAAKDPNAPKRPRSAYLYYCDAERKAVMKKHPDYRVTDVSKELGPAWQKLSDKAKAKYDKLATKDKARYEAEMASYVPPAKRDASPVRKSKAAKAPKDPNAPKRGRNAFLFFSDAERAKVKMAFPNYKITEISTELGSRWKAMSEAQRAPFVAQAQAEKARLQAV